jgi:hypothetical protein
MSPQEFYSHFTKNIHEVAERIAADEIALAKKRVEERVMQEVKNMQVEFQDTIMPAPSPDDVRLGNNIIEVRVRVDFSGMSPRRL